jgi:dihydrofolate reductase
MRQIHMWNQVSADGFFAAPDGGLDWVVQDEAVQREGLAGAQTTGMLLFGRKTFDMFASFWPRLLDEPSTPDPHGGGSSSPELLGFANILTSTPKLVFSKTLRDPAWKNTEVMREVDPSRIRALKQQPGGTIMIMGSASIIAQLTQHELIDEYQFSVSPVLLGRGRTLFGDLAKQTPLRLIETKSYPSGTVLLRYARR